MVRQGKWIQRRVTEHDVAVDGRHQGRGVRQQNVAGRCLQHALGLGVCNGDLFKGLGGAAVLFAPFAQHLGGATGALATRLQGSGQRLRQRGFSGAFGAQQRNLHAGRPQQH